MSIINIENPIADVDEIDDNIVALELDDLLYHDEAMAHIKVDKSIFDCFVENGWIQIKFVNDRFGIIYDYIMVAEDDDGIYMEDMELHVGTPVPSYSVKE